MNVFEIVQNIRTGKTTALEVTQQSLKIIKEKNPEINAFIEVFEDEAIARAKEIDAKKAAGGELGALAGVPIGIKDNLLYKGHKVSCASKMLSNHVSAYTSTVVQRMLDQDAVIIGRVNMDEFAMGSTNETSVYGPVKNPVDTSRIPGGSSGGSAAAVAAGMVAATLGSDTGGSIRQPASLCGIVGFKPTYGRVSRYGLVAFASSADQVGPLAGSVTDAAIMYGVISGYDEKDSTSALEPVQDIIGGFKKDLKGLKVGIPVGFFDNLDDEIKNSFEAAKNKLAELGAELVDVPLPFAKYSAPCYYILTSAEASSNLSRFDGIRYGYQTPSAADLDELYSKTRMEGFGTEVKRRIMIGHYVLSKEKYEACCVKARQVKVLIRKNFKDAFKNVDVIITPTSPVVAKKLGSADDQVNTYLADLFTCPGNMAGIPGISVPCGKNSEGLPIGLQFYADEFKEDTLLKTAYAFEAAQGK
ncbi:aspartyl-tRNA(Asn)/glutamyl-tRNA(Gln) amidotransferase subunit A [Elusimicrobium simillimum]|uniref:Asp-tRNA(Asn)/Glu-tRNA(Gln) amidotransferase subunit GatA n=1 Tax=Elusimicrobium simillimum TaxID=3143438 RepID=UPI003C6F0E02